MTRNNVTLTLILPRSPTRAKWFTAEQCACVWATRRTRCCCTISHLIGPRRSSRRRSRSSCRTFSQLRSESVPSSQWVPSSPSPITTAAIKRDEFSQRLHCAGNGLQSRGLRVVPLWHVSTMRLRDLWVTRSIFGTCMRQLMQRCCAPYSCSSWTVRVITWVSALVSARGARC